MPSNTRGTQEETRARAAVENKESLCAATREELVRVFGPEEVDSHFRSMPPRYWAKLNAEALRWHLSTLHALFQQIAEAQTTTTSPILRWRRRAEEGITEVAVCSWDRPGLLMNIAGALSRAGFDILRAEVYTREDHLALDIFEVRETDTHTESNEIRLRYAARSLAAVMAGPLPSTPAEIDPALSRQDPLPGDEVEVVFDNDSSGDYTLLRVDARDHIGLLFQLLQGCVASGIDVKQATILTSGERARDTFCITDTAGRKIEDPTRLAAIESLLRRAVNRSFNFEPGVWGVDPLNLVDPRV